MLQKILVPIDGSDHAWAALDFAADLACQYDAILYLLHVVKRADVPDGIADYIKSEGIKDTPQVVYLNVMENEIIGVAKDRLLNKGITKIETSVIKGDPAEEIIEYAKENDIDMIIMGSRGLGGVKSIMLGSVSTKVSHGADRTCVIVRKKLLDGKKVLIVDDEPDILESLRELLPMCEVATATSFEEGKSLLETQSFDIAILDIMGVMGFDLLDIAKKKGVIPVMLTAHALSPDKIVESHQKGAASYLPKDKMTDITTFLNDVLEAKSKGMSSWWRWMERLGTYFNDLFGSNWQSENEKFWKNFPYYY